jgi:hypothetical protein
MQGPFSTPGALAHALLQGATTSERIAKLLRHAERGTRAEFKETLEAIPDALLRAQVEVASQATKFRG